MKTIELLNSIKESYIKQFPNSIIIAQLHKGIGKSLYVKCYMSGKKEEFHNGIEENDMLSVTFWCHNIPRDTELDSELPENIEMECTEKSYLIKPENKYLCYGRRKLSYRKTQGTEKIIKSLDKFFVKLKESLENDLENGNITDDHKELLISKLI